MRAVGTLIFAALLACEETRNPVDFVDVQVAARKTADLKVHLQVEGDESLLNVGASWMVMIDNQSTQLISSRALTFAIPEGLHQVMVVRLLSISSLFGYKPRVPPWCDLIPPSVFTDSYVGGSSVELTFRVNCPVRDGSTKARVLLKASAVHVPDSAQVYFLSDIDRTLTSVVIPTNHETDIVLKPGIYRLGIDSPSCPFFGGPYSVLSSSLLLRRDQVVDVSLTLPCP
jgi:hypothetical protein